MILLTGSTGYVGGRLLRALREEGRPVRCLVRRPDALAGRTGEGVETVIADLLKPETLPDALRGIDTAFYLVHSMGAGPEFEAKDRDAATYFATAAKAAGVRKVIFLGGLGEGDDLSEHLESRHETGRILREEGPPTIELRASIIIGSGSLSFEMVRALVDRLPFMITPRWTRSLAQPISIEDVISYLVAALDRDYGESRVFQIGGADRVSYLDIMKEYGRQRGLRRLIIPVPMLTPKLSSLWLSLITPLFARVGRELIDSVRNDTVVTDDAALREFPVRPRGYREEIARALRNEDRRFAETRWSDAFSSSGLSPRYGGVRFGSRLVDSRTATVDVPAAAAFAPIRRIGGNTGWYFASWLWRIRGLMDSLLGGVGHRRGRRDPEHPAVGDTLDFWRVEAYEEDRLLRLSAEMLLPGRAWLQFEVEERDGRSIIRQTALFDPVGLSGLLYWYALFPAHEFIFAGMLRNLARAAESRT